MMLSRSTLLGSLWMVCLASGQPADLPVRFDVASIKSTDHSGPCGIGPGITEFHCQATVNAMMVFAFHLAPYQHSFSMSEGPKYEVIAKVPAALSEEIAKGTKDPDTVAMEMLRGLLADRFKLTYHFDKKELDSYTLTAGKGRPKLTVSPPESLPGSPATSVPPTPKIGKWDGLAPKVVKGEITLARDVYGSVFLLATGATMERFAATAKTFLNGLPVIDATGLTGRYDFSLIFNATHFTSVAKSGTDISSQDLGPAIQRQLGLQLLKKKEMLDIFVMDHVEKPTEN